MAKPAVRRLWKQFLQPRSGDGEKGRIAITFQVVCHECCTTAMFVIRGIRFLAPEIKLQQINALSIVGKHKFGQFVIVRMHDPSVAFQPND